MIFIHHCCVSYGSTYNTEIFCYAQMLLRLTNIIREGLIILNRHQSALWKEDNGKLYYSYR